MKFKKNESLKQNVDTIRRLRRLKIGGTIIQSVTNTGYYIYTVYVKYEPEVDKIRFVVGKQNSGKNKATYELANSVKSKYIDILEIHETGVVCNPDVKIPKSVIKEIVKFNTELNK